jgi:probable selenium-dependent hydroxylase accessory protein YqeC
MDPNLKGIGSIVEKLVKGKKGTRSPLLTDSLGLQEREVISLVGAGGKTTFMFRLARELLLAGRKVVTTTTTKILEPTSEEAPCLIVDLDEDKVKTFVKTRLEQDHHITVAGERLGFGKLRGVSPNVIADLWDLHLIDVLLIEADGAAGRPVKAPREQEPVISPDTTLVVAILGMDGVDAELNEQNVFQPERVSKLTGLRLGDKMTAESLAVVMTHSEGIFKGTPASSRVICFLNKADRKGGIDKGREVAKKILEKKHPQIERVVLGQLKKDPPVLEILFPK